MDINKLQELSILNYRKHGIDITIKDDVVIIAQNRLINGNILTNKDLYTRASEVFPNAKIRPSVYKINTDHIDSKWVKSKMEEYDLKAKDLTKQTTIDAASLSLMLNDERKMNKSVKALFFYYFMAFDMHQGFKDYLEITKED